MVKPTHHERMPSRPGSASKSKALIGLAYYASSVDNSPRPECTRRNTVHGQSQSKTFWVNEETWMAYFNMTRFLGFTHWSLLLLVVTARELGWVWHR